MEKIWAVNQLDSKTAEILLYGYIGGDKVNAADFVAELKQLELKYTTIKLRINSGGGSVFEGLAIFNAIKQSTCNIEAYVDGIAASMASVIVLACNKIYMSKVAMLMTHRPSGAAMGNPDQLRSSAEMLEQLEETICGIYAERTGLPVDQVKAKYLGNSDNWLTAEDAMTAKLIDGIYDAPKPAALPPATMRVEQDLVNYFTNSFNTNNNMKQIILTPEMMAVLCITAEADATAINSAFNTLAAKAAKVDQLQGKVTELTNKLTDIEAAEKTAKIEALVDAAIAANKMAAGDRDKYIKLATADFDTTKELIDAMKPYTSIQNQLSSDASAQAELADLMKMSAVELWRKGKFERLKQISPEGYKTKYKEFAGKEPA